MNNQINIVWLVFLAVLGLISTQSFADTALTGKALVEKLRGGGYSLYFRHEATDWAQVDRVEKSGDWLSCDATRIRQLSNEGRKRAAATGRVIKALGIPVGKVLASPYCRTRDTARLMNLASVEATTDVINLRIADFFGGTAAIVATAQALLATPPPGKTNTLIVAHGNLARAATSVYPDEGEGLVFQADANGGFDFIGRLTAQDWLRLAAE